MTTNTNSLVTAGLIVVGALLVLPLAGMGGMMGTGAGPMMGGWGSGMGGAAPGWMLLFGVLMQLLFLGALVGAGYLVYRALTGADGDDPAVEELRLAYARGDLTDEEYDQRRDALERDS
ncbi:SHOCT domain-containing protein [Halostella litorea]|uniref:SHOCT domain-containing protein n=1 Tax=Halostella litorea TaxID=2528831 RepID=UPI0010918D14|nr:SHOCT domain-containing protein [Halostella litorea]